MDTEDFPCIYLFTNKTDAFMSCIDNNIDHQKKLKKYIHSILDNFDEWISLERLMFLHNALGINFF